MKDALNDPIIAAESYTLWTARVALGAEDSAWEAAFWMKNLFDEQYRAQGVNLTGLGFGYLNVNNARMFGGTLTVRF